MLLNKHKEKEGERGNHFPVLTVIYFILIVQDIEEKQFIY